MEESEFLGLVDTTLCRIEEGIEASGADIDVSRSGNILTLEFEDGAKMVVNSQAALQEIWVAARAGGFHFRRHDGRWVDTRDGSDLFAALSALASRAAGQVVALAA